MSVSTRRGAPRAVWCVLAWRPGRNRRGGSVSLFVRHVLVVASRWGGVVVHVYMCMHMCMHMCVCWAVSTCMCDDYPSGRDLCAADSAVIKRHQGINKTSHPRVAPPSLHCVTFVFLPQNRDGCRSMQAGC